MFRKQCFVHSFSNTIFNPAEHTHINCVSVSAIGNYSRQYKISLGENKIVDANIASLHRKDVFDTIVLPLCDLHYGTIAIQ
jgi:hypothetical protein